VSPRPDELAIGADGAEVRRASEWLEATCQRRGVPQALAEQLVLCLDEVLANVMAHGGRTVHSEPIRLLLEVRAEQDHGQASVTVTDSGIAFDPLSVPKKALPRTLDEATPGGMGLVLLRRFCSVLHYRHEAGRNHLTFGTRWNPR
jgi:anti-sigma regulatory factor (Ser/Thr protein kinase)